MWIKDENSNGGWTCAIMTANKSRNIPGIKARANREDRIFFSDPPTKLVHSDKIGAVIVRYFTFRANKNNERGKSIRAKLLFL